MLCQFLLQLYIVQFLYNEVNQLCMWGWSVSKPSPTLWNPMNCSPPGPLFHGIIQARILEWVAMPSFRGSSWPGIEPASVMSPALAGRFFTTYTTWEAQISYMYTYIWASLVAQIVKNLPAMQETRVHSLFGEDPLEKAKATHSSILAWEIPWTEEPACFTPQGHQESDTTERLTHVHISPPFRTSLPNATPPHPSSSSQSTKPNSRWYTAGSHQVCFVHGSVCMWAPPVVQTIKNLPATQETRAWSLGQEDSLAKGMATHSGIPAWRIPRTEDPGGLQSMGSQRLRQDSATNTQCVHVGLISHVAPPVPSPPWPHVRFLRLHLSGQILIGHTNSSWAWPVYLSGPNSHICLIF